MKPDERNIDDVLRRALPSAPRGQMEAALDRVYARLQSEPTAEAPEAVTLVDRAPRFGWWWKPLIATAAIAAAIWVAISVSGQGSYGVLETSDSSVYRVADAERTPLRFGDRIGVQETVRSNGGGGAVLGLADGSRVEMRSGSELALERADDGLRIRLNAGSIIVNAAKQRNGHLYVKTKDVTVSVVGTVFLVNAEADGSRVGVIEGEVHVREGQVERSLRPGQQVSSPKLVARPLAEEIAWSRFKDAHLAILESFQKGMAATAGPPTPVADRPRVAKAAAGQDGVGATVREFEEASIRPCDPDNVPPLPQGARGGGANSFFMTPGRTYALCMTLATLVRTAYGYGPIDLDYLRPPGTRGFGPDGRGLSHRIVYGLGVEDGRRVRGGPDWVRTERYTIEAVAGGPSDAETMRGPMLQALLETRFKLKAHVEAEQAPAFTLTTAKSGLKITPVESGACERMPPPDVAAVRIPRGFAAVRRGEKPSCGFSNQPNGPNNVIVGGELTLATLAQWLGDPLGRVRVTDMTGVTDKFNFVLEFVWDEHTPGRRRVVPQDGGASDVPRAPSIFSALEEQLGLKLEPARAPREFIVIDRVERPSAN